MKKRNKVIIIILICLVVIGSMFAYSECNFKYELIDLETAYEQDLISYDDLLSIAYYSGNYLPNEDKFSEDFIPKEKGELSTLIKHQIKKVYSKKYNYNYTIFNFTQYEIHNYGEYNGYIAHSYERNITFADGSKYPSDLSLTLIVLNGIKFSWAWREEIYLYKKL